MRNHACGGINDQGLFIDGNGVSATEWEPVEGKPWVRGVLEEFILANCASVEEAIKFVQEHNVPNLKNGRFPMMDKTGRSVVLEWNHGKLQVLERKGSYQISTNFRITDYPDGNYPGYRYRLADKILSGAESYSVDLVKSVLAATHFEEVSGGATTLYSYICDLKMGDVHLYNFHDFGRAYEFNAYKELEKGSHLFNIPRVFPFMTYAQVTFYVSSLYRKLQSRNDIPKAISQCDELSSECLAVFDRDLSQTVYNTLGYTYLSASRYDEAVEVFKAVAEHNPESWNAYDSLGVAYLKKGDKEAALKSYEKALELNPGDTRIQKTVKDLSQTP